MIDTGNHTKWQTEQNCPIFLWFYFSCMRYAPGVLIVAINTMIAWKMRGIANARQELRKDDKSTDVQDLSGNNNISM